MKMTWIMKTYNLKIEDGLKTENKLENKADGKNEDNLKY